MDMIRVALCDDEPEWLESSKRSLKSFAEHNGYEFEISSYGNGQSMLNEREIAPDVLFCDIELGEDKSGIDIVREVSRVWPSCQIVYVTNFLRYAPEVYVTEHLWFVLKDRFEERLPEIFEKLLRQMEDGSKALTLQTTDHDILSIPCTQIVSFERSGRTTTVTLADATKHLVPDRLKDLLERAPQRLFARCHGSFAVGLEHVRLVRRDSIVMQGGEEVPLSRRYARSFRERYLDWVEDHAL